MALDRTSTSAQLGVNKLKFFTRTWRQLSSKQECKCRCPAKVARSLHNQLAWKRQNSLADRLTDAQKRALLGSWKHLRQNFGAVTQRIFQKLIAARPKAKDVFYKVAFMQIFSRYNADSGSSITTLHDHAKILLRLFDDVITNLDQSALTMSDVCDLGRRHAFLRKSGLKAEVWEYFGEAAVEILGSQDCVKQNNDAMHAWTLVIACLTDELRYGFEQGCRMSDKKDLTLDSRHYMANQAQKVNNNNCRKCEQR